MGLLLSRARSVSAVSQSRVLIHGPELTQTRALLITTVASIDSLTCILLEFEVAPGILHAAIHLLGHVAV